MTPEQLFDAVLGNFLFGGLGVFVIGLVVIWLCDQARIDAEEKLDAEVERDVETFGLPAVMRQRWKVW